MTSGDSHCVPTAQVSPGAQGPPRARGSPPAQGVNVVPAPPDRVSAGVLVDDPVFREPWEAQAFAITVLLHQRGLFTWTEWAQALSAQIATRGASGGAATDAGPAAVPPEEPAAHREALETPYYQHWLAALETLVAAKGLSSLEELTHYQHAWERAAQRTPHGHSIDLQVEDIPE